jgi:hypothetical protein
MFCVDNNELKWNIDHLINNPILELNDKSYQIHNNNVTIFHTDKLHSGYKQYMYHFIACDYTLDDNIRRGFCYYCEFGTDNAYKLYKDTVKFNICNTCANKWNLRKNDVQKITNGLYKINDNNCNFDIKYDAISYYNEEESYIIYIRLVIPLKNFNYLSLQHCKIVERTDCDICGNDDECYIYCDCDYDDYTPDPINTICERCLNYAFQIFVNNNLKYMLVNTLDELLDTKSLIIKDFIMLTH